MNPIKLFIAENLFWVKLIAVLAIATALFGAGWTANGWRLHAEISDIKAEQSHKDAQDTQQSLDYLVAASAKIKDSADQYSAIQNTLGIKIDKLRKEFKDAPLPPLPADCKPDDQRMRKLTSTIKAANEAIAR